jgi:hypothetical protein
MKQASYVIHFVLTGLCIGLAAGANAEHLSPLISYGLTGTAVGLGISFLVRFLIAIFV